MIFDPYELADIAYLLAGVALTALILALVDHYWFAPRRRRRQSKPWPESQPAPPDWVNDSNGDGQ